MRADVSSLSTTTVVLLCFAFTPSIAMAQNPMQSCGFKAGVTASTLTPAPSGATSIAPGWVAGVFYTRSKNTLTWQLEGLVQSQSTGIGQAQTNLLYLHVPFLLRMNFRQDRSTFFYAIAGASAGFLLAATLDQDSGRTDLASLINRTAIDAVLGVGCDFARRYSVDVRWNEGLRKTSIFIDGKDTRSRAVIAAFGFRFGG